LRSIVRFGSSLQRVSIPSPLIAPKHRSDAVSVFWAMASTFASVVGAHARSEYVSPFCVSGFAVDSGRARLERKTWPSLVKAIALPSGLQVGSCSSCEPLAIGSSALPSAALTSRTSRSLS
jgi:hypothetical protein